MRNSRRSVALPVPRTRQFALLLAEASVFLDHCREDAQHADQYGRRCWTGMLQAAGFSSELTPVAWAFLCVPLLRVCYKYI